MSHISAVVFDYGNVLSDLQDDAAIDAMADLLALDRPRFLEVYWQFRVAYDEAALDPESYWQAVARAADQTLQSSDIDRLRRIDVQSWIRPHRPMVQWATRVRKAGFKTAVLSNMPADLREYLLGPESWLPAFDELTFSCEIGCSKPDARIYHHCLERLDVPASETLFLDDRAPNAEGARAIGMHTLLFTDTETAARDLEGRFLLPAVYCK
ncbi:MAG: HAD family hydrolase [Bryobacteraceae bacterium]